MSLGHNELRVFLHIHLNNEASVMAPSPTTAWEPVANISLSDEWLLIWLEVKKPQIWPILAHQVAQIFGHSAKNQIISEHSPNKHKLIQSMPRKLRFEQF